MQLVNLLLKFNDKEKNILAEVDRVRVRIVVFNLMSYVQLCRTKVLPSSVFI
jgi:hypothetical protein